MPESEVLSSILDDFTAKNPELATEQLRVFCDYAAIWLAANSVVGVGHAPSGISLRFSDGRELLLFAPLQETIIPVPGDVNITGTESKITKPVANSPSVQITGH
jgi:hypothetical protein